MTVAVQPPLDPQLFRMLLEHAPEAVMLADANTRIVYVNRAFEETTGYSAAEAVGQRPSLLSSGYHDADFYRTMWSTLSTQGRWQGLIWNRRRNGDLYPEWLNIFRLHHGSTVYYAGLFTDISAMDTLRHDLQRYAYYDTLTELPNRALFMALLDSRLRQGRREQGGFAVLFADIDHFKQINDVYGHPTGDEIIRQVGTRLRETLREADTVARFAGDEFVLLIDTCNTLQDLSWLCERVLGSFASPLQAGARQLQVGITLGAALYPEHGTDAPGLMQHADLAMYCAKQRGRGRFMIYEDRLSQPVQRAASVLHALHGALASEREEFRIFAQPQFDLRDGRMTGFELLLRWTSPTLGEVSPGEFIPLAEQNGLAGQITERVIRLARRLLPQLPTAWLQGLVIALNVSAGEFQNPNLAQRLRPLLKDCQSHGLDLEIEVTETQLMRQFEQDPVHLLALVSDGIHLAIDDFGTGYSSLAYLRRLPIRTLKIDRSFIQDIAQSPQDSEIVSTILAMAHNLALHVVAEGIETDAQQARLQALGCPGAQGFLYARPMPLEGLAEHFRTRRWSSNDAQHAQC